jgi:hypothetical protein
LYLFININVFIFLAAAGLTGAMGIPGATGLSLSGVAGSSQQEQYIAAVQAAAAAAATQQQQQGQSAGLSVPLLPYPYGTAGVPWGAVYNPMAAAQAAANLAQHQHQLNGGIPVSQAGMVSTQPTNNAANLTNGRRLPTPPIQTTGPPTPGPPSDNSTQASGAAGQNASPNAQYIIPAFIDPSSGQLVRLSGGAGQIPTPTPGSVRLMGPAHPGQHAPGTTTPQFVNNQQQAQQQQLAANLAALAASNPAAAAAAAQAAGFPASLALLNHQPNNLGVGGHAGNNSSNISSLGSPSISSISGTYFILYLTFSSSTYSVLILGLSR